MQPFTTFTAVAAPLDITNVNTDMLIPARFLRKPRDERYGSYLFHDLSHDEDGRLRDSFVLNEAVYQDAKILVAGANFGCGSSRESAVYVLLDSGFRCVIAPSFGDIFFGNALQNGVLPVVLPEAECIELRAWLDANPGATITADLQAQTVAAGDVPDPGENGIANGEHVFIPGDGEKQSVRDREVAVVEGMHLRRRLSQHARRGHQ